MSSLLLLSLSIVSASGKGALKQIEHFWLIGFDRKQILCPLSRQLSD
jgi:hypothetical protein